MNSTIQNLRELLARAFDECSSAAEMKYVAQSMMQLYRNRRQFIAELLAQRLAQRD